MVDSFEQLTSIAVNFSKNYFVFNDWEFISSLIMIVICPITWNLFARWEFHTKIFSKMAGDNRLAADIFAHILIEMGVLRNYLFSRTIRHQPQLELDESFSLLISTVAVLMIAGGLLLTTMSYYRLGIHGIYYADYFGILMDEMVTEFPYNVLDNPLYVGSTLLFFGNALMTKSPAGILLAIVAWVMYKFASVLENPMTNLIYDPENIKRVRKMSKERDRRESRERRKKHE